jgi:hypothetical protein
VNPNQRIKRIVLLNWIKSLGKPALAPLLLFGIHILALASGAYRHIRGIEVDEPMHFFGGMAMAYFIHRALFSASERRIIGPYHQLTHRLLVFTGTCTVAVFWEFAEFALDWRFRARFQSGVSDTMADLFFGLIGALFLILITALACKHHSPQQS